MNPARTIIRLRATVVAAREWCPRCQLPSRHRIAIWQHERPDRWLGQLAACDTCHEVEKL